MSCEGQCACLCHTDVEEPGPHLDSCSWADPDYEPHVCPGCYAVGGEPCAAYCIDDEIRRGQDEPERWDWGETEHDEGKEP